MYEPASKKLLKTAIKMVGKKTDRILSAEEYEKLQKLYRMILSDALSELPLFLESEGRGRTKLTDAQNLWEAFIQHEESILLFARVAEVDATNNRAERDLRMSKVKKKVSGCFRNPDFAGHYSGIEGRNSCLKKWGGCSRYHIIK